MGDGRRQPDHAPPDRRLRFDGRTAIVTGAGTGLGREYALELARRGARVVVNDVGAALDGNSTGEAAAAAVAAEIRADGGQAVANTDSVTDGERIVAAAVEAFGGVDILVNNAGIIRDHSFAKTTDADLRAVWDVHVNGAWRTTQAAWRIMTAQSYGRIVFASSAAGLYGNFGQANYSAAKSALLGLMRTLAREGAGKHVYSNAIAPLAATRMTESITPPELAARLRPRLVVPLVVALVHDRSTENGALFEAGAGWMARLRWQRSRGLRFDPRQPFAAEDIAERWHELGNFGTGAEYPGAIEDSLRAALAGSA